jgi:hypothetical protein
MGGSGSAIKVLAGNKNVRGAYACIHKILADVIWKGDRMLARLVQRSSGHGSCRVR